MLIRVTLGLLLLLGAARAQTVDPPTNVKASLDREGEEIIVTWTPPTVPNGSLSYRVKRVTLPADSLPWVKPDTAVIDNIQDWTWYNDHEAKACYRYIYTVVAIWHPASGQSVESQSSDKAELLIKGGVNAVVIFPTPEAVAVAGSPYELQIRACDRDTNATLTYQLYKAPVGMSIDTMTGLITWMVPLDVAGNIYNVKVVVKDNGGSYAWAYVSFRVIDEVSFSVHGTVRLSNGGRMYGSTQVMLISATTLSGLSTYTDSAGNFSFTRLGRGAYKLAYRNWFYDRNWWQWYENASSSSHATLIQLQDVIDVTLDTIQIPVFTRRSTKVRGKLTDGHGPLANATVSAIAVGSFLRNSKDVSTGQVSVPQLESGEAVRTGSDGSYSVSVDSGRRYALLASRPGYQAQFVGATGSTCATPFCATQIMTSADTSVSDGALSQSDTAGQQIVGTVTSLSAGGDGVRAMILLNKLKGGTITSGYSGGLVPFDVISSDTAGNFEIRSIPRDADPSVRYILQAIPYVGAVPAYYTNGDTGATTSLWESATLIQLDSNKAAPYQVDVHVVPIAVGAGIINGTVRLSDPDNGAPVENAFVYAIDDATGIEKGYAITDGTGAYTIANLPIGAYHLLCDKIGFRHGFRSNVAITDADSGVSSGNALALFVGPSGVREFLAPGAPTLVVYPNPAVTNAVVSLNRPVAQVLVRDLLGRVVADWTAELHSGASTTIDLSRLPAGPYFAVVRPEVGPISTVPLHVVR